MYYRVGINQNKWALIRIVSSLCISFTLCICICVYRSTEATAEMEELARNANPDEINIAEDDDEDIQPVEGRMIVFLNKNKI